MPLDSQGDGSIVLPTRSDRVGESAESRDYVVVSRNSEAAHPSLRYRGAPIGYRL